jgi:uncharacterized protein Yka (UPF0111/DUF47 family)
MFNDMMNNYVDVTRKASEIHDLEHAGDSEVHKMYDSLHTAFITPIDREDLFGLIKSVDDITDLIEDAANRFDMFAITAVRPEAIAIGIKVEKATKLFRHRRSSARHHQMERYL